LIKICNFGSNTLELQSNKKQKNKNDYLQQEEWRHLFTCVGGGGGGSGSFELPAAAKPRKEKKRKEKTQRKEKTVSINVILARKKCLIY
jgi:hypothetical protein